MRRRFKWTKKQIDRLNHVTDILHQLKKYKPLTLRQIYYQLVGKGYIENNVSQYVMLSTLIKWARIDGYINWEDVEDRVRVYHGSTGWSNISHFIQRHISYFLTGYDRDLMQDQKKYIEIWIEKDALSSIFVKVASEYRIPVVVCRGFASVSFLNDFIERMKYYKNHGKENVMLYFGDFDPSGVAMLDAIEETLMTELNAPEINFKRIALMKNDIMKYKLPHNPNALKKKDTRAANYVEKYGEIAVELDALSPIVLEKKIEDAILSEIDVNILEEARKQEIIDRKRIERLKKSVEKHLEEYS